MNKFPNGQDGGFEVSLIESISQLSPVAEDSLELLLDREISNDILKEIPVIKYFVAVSKGILGVRDYLFVKKILGFLNETERIDKKLREDFGQKLRKEKKEKEVGMHIVELIDKSFGVWKAKLIGKAFVLFLEDSESYSYEYFLRLSEMIVGAYESDLKYFYDTEEGVIDETGDEVEHLIVLGFYERGKKAFGDRIMESTKPNFTKFGNTLRLLKIS